MTSANSTATKKIIRTIAPITLLACCAIVSFFIFRQGKWERYYRNKLYLPASEVVQKAAENFEKPGTAIDLGCGIGNEAAFLINSGWRVFAIDNQPIALEMLQARDDIDADQCITIKAAFDDDLDWNTLPTADLIYASYALPFSNPNEFEQVWGRIKEKIHLGGRFAGHFFGPDYQGFSENEKSAMCFHNRHEIKELLKDFHIDYLHESKEDTQSGTGKKIRSHIFDVIATKRYNRKLCMR